MVLPHPLVNVGHSINTQIRFICLPMNNTFSACPQVSADTIDIIDYRTQDWKRITWVHSNWTFDCVSLLITRQRWLYSPSSVQNWSFLLSCNVMNGTFSVCRLPFVHANLFRMVFFNLYTKYERQVKTVILRLLSTTVYFWDPNEQCLLYMFTLAD